MRDINRNCRGNTLAKTDVTHYNAKLGIPEHNRAIKELVIFWVLLILIPWVFGLKWKDYPGCLTLR